MGFPRLGTKIANGGNTRQPVLVLTDQRQTGVVDGGHALIGHGRLPVPHAQRSGGRLPVPRLPPIYPRRVPQGGWRPQRGRFADRCMDGLLYCHGHPWQATTFEQHVTAPYCCRASIGPHLKADPGIEPARHPWVLGIQQDDVPHHPGSPAPGRRATSNVTKTNPIGWVECDR